MSISNHLVIGVDYGSDSARAILIDAESGKELALSVKEYTRWKKGMYCDPVNYQFRQHPLDYIESLEFIINDVINKVPGSRDRVKALAIDVTCSTPIVVDKEGTPLSLRPDFAENPNGMFILWKDHTGIEECDHINEFSQKWHTDYTKYAGGGGNYSAEHFWAKALHVFKTDPDVRKVGHSFVDACDWLSNVIVGINKPEELKRNICTAGFKVLWNKEWGGYPPNEYFKALDPVLDGLVNTFSKEVYTCVEPIGHLTDEWANRLGLTTNVIVAAGNIDAHAGGIGAGVKNKAIVQIIGTSTCDIIVGPKSNGDRLIPGISGQADDSIIPGMIGYEAGQSVYGDYYAWFKKVLMWPLREIFAKTSLVDEETKQKVIDEVYAKMIPTLAEQAKLIPTKDSHIIATDWINGRRTPNVDYTQKGTITGLALSSSTPLIYKAIVEATAYGSRAIVEQFINNGIEIEEIIAVGGISQKSPYVMQVLSDVLGMPIKVIATREACALGVAMCASVAAGIYPKLEIAQEKMGMGISTVYTPNPDNHAHYNNEYKKYKKLDSVKELTQ
ncbi:ribulokinase [Apibacter muscae]|uniref:Ribulokinase n=1 Tax=Apibacter muscae TaxID=2509004 RepID=A0A563DFB8_9FLAO|nr:ribulokinase [Apibacter muscae]TWP28792.1 ribulokinase [Apibacter muscae]